MTRTASAMPKRSPLFRAGPVPGAVGRQESVVRQLVAEAAWQALRRSTAVRAYFERVQRGDPQRKKIALVATAHYLARAMWAMLRRGTVWQESPALAA